MAERIVGTGKTLGFDVIKSLIGKTVHLEFNNNPEFHVDIEIPSDIREPNVFEWEREGFVAIMESRTDWPNKIYESTKIVFPPEVV